MHIMTQKLKEDASASAREGVFEKSLLNVGPFLDWYVLTPEE